MANKKRKNDFPRRSGIYCIENKINNMKYIGKTVNLKSRRNTHITELNRGKSQCSYLQNAWDKYGEESFVFYIVEECSIEELNEKEIFYIKFMETKRPVGYNLTDGGDGVSGRKLTKEQKKRISDTRINSGVARGENNPNYGGIFHGERTWTGCHHSEEAKKKISENSKGNKYSLGKKREHSKSIYHGLCFQKEKNRKWRVRISINGKLINLGTFEKEEDAARAYDDYIIKNNLPNPLNFKKD